MSKTSNESRGKLVVMPNSLENIRTEPSKRTPQKHREPLFSFPQSPKFSIQMFTDLQDQLRLKEIDFLEIAKAKRRLEQEINDFKKNISEKENEINRLSEENLSLRSQIREGDYNMTDYWKKEVLRKNEGLKKIQEQFKLQEKENKLKNDGEMKKVIQYFEEEKKCLLKKVDGLEKQVQSLTCQLKDLEKANETLKFEKSRLMTVDFEKQLQELEEMQQGLIQENSTLKQELEIIRRGNNLQDLALLSSDIHKVSRQVHHLLTILKNLKQGKDISLYLLLEMDDSRIISSSRQLALDVSQLKKDLNEIKEIVSDYHAEIVGGAVCVTQ